MSEPGPRIAQGEISAVLGFDDLAWVGAGASADLWRSGDKAIKIIAQDGFDPARVQREVNGLSAVDCSNVVRLIETRTATLGGRPRPVLIFEYVDGGSLRAHIDACDGRGIDPDMAADLLHGLLTGIAALHAAGIRHRDIKPENIGLRTGTVMTPVILDLGISRGLDDSTITMVGAPLGTARYMAPEQLELKPARKAADLFAVGVTVREAITGAHPFHDAKPPATFGEALDNVRGEPAELPSTVPAHVRAVLDRLTSTEQHDRGSAASALKRLENSA